MVVGTLPLEEKGHPHRELNPHREHNTIYLHSLCFPVWLPVWVPTTHYLHFLDSLHFPVFPAFPCMAPCIYPHHSHVPTFSTCMGSIPCVGDLFALRALSPPHCTCIPCISLHGSLHESPPFPCTYIPFVPAFPVFPYVP